MFSIINNSGAGCLHKHPAFFHSNDVTIPLSLTYYETAYNV